jgi:hypothetical protein
MNTDTNSKAANARNENREKTNIFIDTITLRNWDAESKPALLIDASKSGLGIISKEFYEVGTRQAFELFHSYFAIGEVVENNYIASGDQFRIGVHLTQRDEDWPW